MTTLNQAEKQEAAEGQTQQKSVRISHIFAAHRQVLIEEFQERMRHELIPAYVANLDVIRRKRDEIVEKYGNEALANNKVKPEILELTWLRDQDIEKTKKEFLSEISALVTRFNGVRITESEKHPITGKDMNVDKVQFPDKSKANIYRLFIPYQELESRL